MKNGHDDMKKSNRAGVGRLAALALLVPLVLGTTFVRAADSTPAASTQPTHVQSTFASPEEAAKALADAMRSEDRKQIWRVLGPGAAKLIHSGDPVQDEKARQAFVAAYDQSVKFERSDDRVTVVVGTEDFPFPYPLVMKDGRWRFDAKQGDEEVLNRRIGRNEIAAINVCLAYVDAQREYATGDRNGNGLLEYAQKLMSSPGKHDGLFWETAEGEAPSPLGPLVAKARSQGYGQQSPGPSPYHGYYYKILTGQGRSAHGGAYDYIVNGKMIGGFGLVAYPSKWGSSGVMTFICNQDGIVYEKNLGSETASIASKMTLFDPDSSWNKSQDQ
ncbi:MAG TPA: DUF2950 domain-containing protein [Burkholderiaceae bacterium]|nr:DUF2950 domain-containing protein [Burkholderiaceae bacterium]